MNHLEEAKNNAECIAQNTGGEIEYTAYGVLNALIAIAEQLEIANKPRQEIYDEGYEAGLENVDAEIEFALGKREDK